MIKTIGTQLALFLEEPDSRRNISTLIKFASAFVLVVVIFNILFHVIMVGVEGERHSLIAGLYWTLVTMSTLGFGDITFESDLGRAFSLLVLFSGVVLLLVVFPFVFIRSVLAPWLEAQIRPRAPREIDPQIRDHVIFCEYDAIAASTLEELHLRDHPGVVLEPDADRAAALAADGVPTIRGDLDDEQAYLRAGAPRARLIVANRDDVTNTNVILTALEVAPDVPIASIASSPDAIDLMELAGATHVLPLRQQLGERLASRANTGHSRSHVLGRIGALTVAEFPASKTPFDGRRLGDGRLDDDIEARVVGVWEQGSLVPPDPDRVLSEHSTAIVVAADEQIRELDARLGGGEPFPAPVIVIGCGKVGRAATEHLQRRGVVVHMVERQEALAERWKSLPDRMLVGDAASRDLLESAGISEAPAVIITGHDDAMNVFLAAYCRRLAPAAHISSRVTHQRNVNSIQRAGADLVLSYSALGMEALISLTGQRAFLLLGEGIEIFPESVPRKLSGVRIGEAGIRQATGLRVAALEDNGRVSLAWDDQTLEEGQTLYFIGTPDQHQRFKDTFAANGSAYSPPSKPNPDLIEESEE